MEHSKKSLYFSFFGNLLAWTVLIALFGFTLQSYYELYWPVKVLEVETPVKILTPKVHPGESVKYEVHFCRYTDGVGKVTRTLYGPVIIPTAVVASLAEKGCRVVTVLFPIPSDIPVGEYHIKWIAEFPVNERRTITKMYESENFMVIAK